MGSPRDASHVVSIDIERQVNFSLTAELRGNGQRRLIDKQSGRSGASERIVRDGEEGGEA